MSEGKASRSLRRVYTGRNVLEAARDRLRGIFAEYDGRVFVNFSGGKDSTVIFHLSMEAAEEGGYLPLHVCFIDQEAEWMGTVEIMRVVMNDHRVKPMWLQIPMRLFNATSHDTEWLHCWEPGKKWMREKEHNSIHENYFGTQTFKKLFPAMWRSVYPEGPIASIAGMRVEESMVRRMMLMKNGFRARRGKDDNWGYSPIYDWSYTDVWKAICDHGWLYNRVYDAMYQKGVPDAKMRISNLHHEHAVQALWQVQEIEPETWERLVERLPGIHTVAHQTFREMFAIPDHLPEAFKTWREYRDYLCGALCNENAQGRFAKIFASDDRLLRRAPLRVKSDMYRAHVSAVLRNDWHDVTLINKRMKFRSDYV